MATFIQVLILISWQIVSACGAPPSLPIRVAVYSDTGAGRSQNDLWKVLQKAPNIHAKKISAQDIRNGALKQFDVLMHPGGSGGKQGRRLGDDGRAKVRAFVKNGGGFVGICAGAYLATNDYSWSLGILDAKVLDKKHWARGFGKVQIELSNHGKKILAGDKKHITIYYHQGPLLAPNNDPTIPNYQPLAIFKSEIAKNGAPKGIMSNATAIAAGRFGRGGVFCFSPHPEKTRGLDGFVLAAVQWAASFKVTGQRLD